MSKEFKPADRVIVLIGDGECLPLHYVGPTTKKYYDRGKVGNFKTEKYNGDRWGEFCIRNGDLKDVKETKTPGVYTARPTEKTKMYWEKSSYYKTFKRSNSVKLERCKPASEYYRDFVEVS